MSHEAGPERWTVTVKVSLSRAETDDLFLSGESMVSWPVEGLLHTSGEEPIPERGSIFVSEVAAHPSGASDFFTLIKLRPSGPRRC